jgi:hypothetical protein
MAQCLDAQMRVVKSAFPQPLSEPETALFGQLFFQQPHFGGLTLVLLAERVRFLQRALWDVCVELGDASSVAVLHRLLQYYATMADGRRSADLAIKRGRPEIFNETAKEPPSRTILFFQAIANHLREKGGIECSCEFPEWTALLGDQQTDHVTIQFSCSRCASMKDLTVTKHDLKQAGTELFARFRTCG